MATTTMAQALNTALRDAMTEDDSVVMFGEDVGTLGGVFRITDGLARDLGDDRCFDTPLAEAGIMGMAIGMAMNGFRPVVEMQFDAFAFPAFEQVVSHVAKMRNRTRGSVNLPIVIRIPTNGGIGGVEHHCDSSEAYYAHTPGLQVVTPATVADAYSLLRSAIESPDPVVFLEPKHLYWSKADVELPVRTEPFGKAAVRRAGTGATLITYGASLPVALRAAEAAAEEGWDLEVIDLRTLVPFDDDTIAAVGPQDRSGRRRARGVGLRRLRRRDRRPHRRAVLPPPGGAGPPGHRVRHPLPAADAGAPPPAVRGPDPRRGRAAAVGRPGRRMSDVKVFALPDLGEGLTEAEVVRWLVAVGDTIAIDQPVVEVETAKAVVEVPSPYGGVVVELHGAAGSVLDVGAPLISVASSLSAVESRREEEKAGAGSGAVLVGYGTTEHGRRRSRGGRGRAAQPAAAVASAPVAPAAAATSERPRVISPVVRRLARELGLDLSRLQGSGLDGLILRRDVEAAGAATPSASVSTSSQSTVSAVRPSTLVDERIPLRGLRRTVADKLSRSRREIPDASTWVDVDATGLIEARRAINAANPDRTVGLLALVARFCVLGLHRFPELNATVDTEAEEIVRLGHINLGFAAQTDRGLVVPVIAGAHAMSTFDLSASMGSLVDAARTGKLAPAQMTGGTFTVNNYGVFGVDGSTPIINHPEAAILGIGRIIDKPWVVDGQLTVRKVTQLSLSFDHRVCDGGVAGGFIRFVADCVERPLALLGDL